MKPLANKSEKTVQPEQSRTALRYRADGTPKVHVLTRSNAATIATWIALVVFTVIAIVNMRYGRIETADQMHEAWGRFFEKLAVVVQGPYEIFFNAARVNYTTGELFDALWVSVGISILATVYGSLIALFISLFASANLTNKMLSNALKAIMAVIRSVPTLIWVLVFGIGIGLGSEAAVVGMGCHSVAFLVKAYSEAFEETDPRVLEALRSTGASWWQVVFRGVFADKMAEIVSWTFIRFESNFRNAVSVGALVGAGGIGYNLYMTGKISANMTEVGLIVYMCVGVSIVLEIVSSILRNRYLMTEEQKERSLYRRFMRRFVKMGS